MLCWKNNINLVEFSKKGIVFGFFENLPLNPKKIFTFGFDNRKKISIRPDQKIFYDFFGELNEDRFELIKKIIKKFN